MYSNESLSAFNDDLIPEKPEVSTSYVLGYETIYIATLFSGTAAMKSITCYWVQPVVKDYCRADRILLPCQVFLRSSIPEEIPSNLVYGRCQDLLKPNE